MSDIQTLQEILLQRFRDSVDTVACCANQLTMEIPKTDLLNTCVTLRDEEAFQFDQLMDVCGVDYLQYGLSYWQTNDTTRTGFDRGVKEEGERVKSWTKPRFAVVYHLLSTTLNQRLRLRVYLDDHDMMIDSVIAIWNSANWFEREAFDLYGILFTGHPDLRRILTDYGFIGHPFRKDFPLSGYVEVRYDAAKGRVIYEPVQIDQRTLVPKVIRDDNRYQAAVPLPPKPVEAA